MYMMSYIFNLADHLMVSLNICGSTPLRNDIIQANIVTLFSMVYGILIDTPVSYYRAFVIEEKWGHNKMTMDTFVKDLVKSTLLMIFFQGILYAIILWLVSVSGDNLVFYLSIAMISFILLAQIIIPIFIMPMFYEMTDLKEGSLKTAIYKEAEKTCVNVTQIKVIDGSTRSSHSNAFVIGFSFFRKVVIFDTLIDQQEEDEITAVVNHELGHVAYNHTIWGTVITSIKIVAIFYAFTYCLGNTEMLQSFGFNLETTANSSFVYLGVFALIIQPLTFPFEFLSSYMSRVMEY